MIFESKKSDGYGLTVLHETHFFFKKTDQLFRRSKLTLKDYLIE